MGMEREEQGDGGAVVDGGSCKCWYAHRFCFHKDNTHHAGFTDVDFDPRKIARDERKAKMAKNERQHQQNLARAQGESGAASSSAGGRELQSHRKKDIDRTLAVTRTSTASMGRFDNKLEGEKKLKGVKRKVCLSF